MLIYTKPAFGVLPVKTTSHPWPKVVTCQVQHSKLTWTVIYHDGTHKVATGLEGLRALDQDISPDNLRMWYYNSREVK
jgi:hypothetical protein